MRRGVKPELCGGLLVIILLWLTSGASAAAAPFNDDFDNAQPLAGALPIEVSGTNVDATAQAGEPLYSPYGGHTIWFRWQATSTEVVTMSTCGSEIPALIAVYIGNSIGALTEVASTTREFPGCEFEEGTQATFTAVSGKTYSIQVDGSTYHEASQPPVSGEGAIELHIHHRSTPANDDFADAKAIQPDSLAFSAPNFGATKEAGEPDHRDHQGGASVWFKFTAPRTGGAWIQMDGGPVGHESIVAAYTGSSVDNLTPVPAIESWGDAELAFPVVAGVTYRIAVDGKYNPSAETAFMDEPEIYLSTFPRNDDFEDAFQLGGGPSGGTYGQFFLGNAGATKQPGEPDHAGNRGGASVWFSWTAYETGSVGLNACGADFPTLLAAYTGSSLPGLTFVAASSNPQSPPCDIFGSGPYELSFNVDAGTTYRIAVDGYEGAWGSFGLVMHMSKERLASSQSGRPPSEPGRPPRTRIAGRHLSRHGRTAIFHLRSSESGSSFLCKLDRRPFLPCGPTVAYRKLKPSWHSFRAKAVSLEGVSDPTPSVFRFTTVR